MNHHQKQPSMCLLAVAALLAIAPMQGVFAGKAPPPPKSPALGAAKAFAVLGGTAVTCTNGGITGDVGVFPGTAYTNTTCPVTGKVPPATNKAAATASRDFLRAYDALVLRPSCINVLGDLAEKNLSPGLYCVDSVEKAGTLTLSGPANGVWIFLVNGAFTGTNFTVTMADGGQACNVWWAPDTAVTMTTSNLVGNILAGDVGEGSISLTGGTLDGRALANVAVTTTDAVITRPASGKGCPK